MKENSEDIKTLFYLEKNKEKEYINLDDENPIFQLIIPQTINLKLLFFIIINILNSI